MADLIDRQWLMERLGIKDDCRECQYCQWLWCSQGSEFVNACEAISDAPSVQPEPRWIPCEERLPENGHYYLWCSDMGSVQSDYYWNGFENGMKYGYNIVAWMPLPRAYKEDSDG